MSRFRGFLLSVVSGYASILANTLFTLASIPLALRYLTNEEFGVWALTTQVVLYLNTIDLGMGSAIARLLIDAKDEKTADGYASVVATSWVVQLLQAVGILVLGGLFAWAGSGLFPISASLSPDFRLLVLLQTVILAFQFTVSIHGNLLSAHQRLYVVNWSQVAHFIVAYGVLLFAFARGMGLISMVVAAGAATLVGSCLRLIACLRLGLLPPRLLRQPFSKSVFRNIYRLGLDTYLAVLGSQLIMASQTLVLSFAVGVTTAAVWSIATRPFLMAGQLVWRFFDSSMPALAEMMARREVARLQVRFEDLNKITGLLGVAAGAMLIAVNQPFLAIWTHGRIQWGLQNDILLAFWLLALSVTHSYSAYILATKQLGFLRFIFFAEGIASVTLGYVAARWGGMTGLLASSLLCTLCFHGLYVLRRTAAIMGVPWREVTLRWQSGTVRAALLLFPLAMALNRLLHAVGPALHLALAALGIGGGLAVLGWRLARHGLADPTLVARLWQRLPRTPTAGLT